MEGIAVQAVGILAGILFYLPFLKMNQRMEVYKAKCHVQVLIHELQEKEEQIDQPVFLTRGDHIGMISRMLLLDLKHAIKNKELYMLYQPQVYSDGTCIGAEDIAALEPSGIWYDISTTYYLSCRGGKGIAGTGTVYH